MHRRFAAALLALLVLSGMTSIASARVIYVDNRIGNDGNNGLAATNRGLLTGPVKTFDRAVALLGAGDSLEIANNGEEFPYYDSLRLIGGDASGIPSLALVVEGNGAILDGSEPVPAEAWEPLGHGLWRMIPWEKGWYRLYRGGETLVEVESQREKLAELSPGEWTSWRGAIYYQALPEEIPRNVPFRLAAREAGVFLYGVHHVVIRDLTVRRYRLDGVNAHDQAGPVILEGVRSIENARSGVFVGGTSKLLIRGGTIQDNGAASVLARELGQVKITETDLDSEPRVGAGD